MNYCPRNPRNILVTYCRIKHTRSETWKAKNLVLNKSSVQGTLPVESKGTLKQIKKNTQTNKQNNNNNNNNNKTKTNEREKKEAFKSGGLM